MSTGLTPLTTPTEARLQDIGSAEILIGIPSYNNADTVGHVVRALSAGLVKYFPSRRAVLVNSDGGSSNVLAMGIILLGALFTAWVFGSFVERLFRVIGFDHLCNRLKINAALLRGGVKTDPSRIVGRSIYWTVLVLASITALEALNLTPINQFAQSLLAYVPHLVTAAVILLAGYFPSNFVSQAVLIAAVNAGLPPARLIAACSRWGLQVLAGAMALEQLGIAQHIVVVGFGITRGGIVLAGAIAFGLGAVDLAKEFLERRLVTRSKSSTVDDLHHW